MIKEHGTNNLNNLSYACKLKTARGITLVALVVTIVIMLILAGVTLNIALGDNGLFKTAEKATEAYEQSAKNEVSDMEELEKQLGNMLGGLGSSSPEPSQKSTLAQATKDGTVFGEKNVELEDEYGNKVVVPKGFKVLKDGESNVEYKYSGNKESPTVQDGVVIENIVDENQFVWIPVGDIKNRDDSSTAITLGRYTFDETGTPSSPKNGADVIEEYFIEETKTEHETSQYKNAIAKDIEEFKESVTSNGGYYLARYEASYGGKNKPLSKPSIGEPVKENGGEYAPTEIGQLWTNITQPNAVQVAQNMYAGNENCTSDLVNSYAWDTAIVFIQSYSGDTNYSRKNGTTFSNELRNTGSGDSEVNRDRRCNIYDMAGNCCEWTTETYKDNTAPCVVHGGDFNNSNIFTSFRYYRESSHANWGYSFRVALYINSSGN